MGKLLWKALLAVILEVGDTHFATALVTQE